MSTILFQNERYLNSRGYYASNYYKLRTSVYLESHSITNNTSVVRYVIELGANTTGTSPRWSNANYYLSVDRNTNNSISGNVVNHRQESYSGNGTRYGYVTLVEYQETLSHKQDGTLTLNASFSGTRTAGTSTYVPVNFSVSSGAIEVTPIPRVSTFTTNKTQYNYGDDVSIEVTRHIDNVSEKVLLSGNNSDWQDCTSDIGISGESTYFFTLFEQIANALTQQNNFIRIRLETYIDDSLIGFYDSQPLVINTPNSFKPTIDFTIDDLSNHLGLFGGFVKGKSNIRVNAQATLKYNASLTQMSLSNGINTINGSETSLSNEYVASGATYSANASDSRGLQGSGSITPTCYDYNVPALTNVVINRTSENGTLQEDGAFFTIQFNYSIANINNHNTRQASVIYKVSGSQEQSSASIDLDSYSGIASKTIAISTEEPYEVQLSLRDYFTEVKADLSLPTAYTLIHFGDNGKSIAIGKVSTNETNKLEFAQGWRIEGGIFAPTSIEGTIASATHSNTSDEATHATNSDVASKLSRNVLYSSTSLLQGSKSTTIDVTGYSLLKVYACLDRSQCIFNLDLQPEYSPTSKLDSSVPITSSGVIQEYLNSRYETHSINVGVSGNTGSVTFKVINCGYTYNSTSAQRNNNASYGVYRIEGIK